MIKGRMKREYIVQDTFSLARSWRVMANSVGHAMALVRRGAGDVVRYSKRSKKKRLCNAAPHRGSESDGTFIGYTVGLAK